MRAYSIDLRERLLRDSNAGMKTSAVAVTYHVSAAWVRRLTHRRRATGEVAPRQQRYGRRPVLTPPAAHARGADPGATGPHPRRTIGGPRHVGQSDDHLTGREPAGLHPYKKRYARPHTTAPTSRPLARSG